MPVIGGVDVYQLPMALRFTIVAIYCIIAASLLHSNPKLKNRQRLPLALIVVVGNAAMPLLFSVSDEICSFAVIALQLMWLASFKALGWAINRGPLVESFLTHPQFIAVFSLPITPVLPKSHLNTKTSRARQAEPGNTVITGLLGFSTKLICLFAVVAFIQDTRTPRLVTEFLMALGLYLFIASIMDCLGAVSLAVLNLSIAPHFDAPYLSCSLADYWSRRWNLTVGYVLRFVCYDPVIEGRLIAASVPCVGSSTDKKTDTTTTAAAITKAAKEKGVSSTRRALATCWAFFISGVMHEVFIIYMRCEISWYWLAFFTIQGPLVVLEGIARRFLRSQNIKVPWVVSWCMTLSVLLVLGDLLFFPYVVKSGITQQVLDNIYQSIPQWQ